MQLNVGSYTTKGLIFGPEEKDMWSGRRSVRRCPDCRKHGKVSTLFCNYHTQGVIKRYWCECGYTERKNTKKWKDLGLDYPVIQRPGEANASMAEGEE